MKNSPKLTGKASVDRPWMQFYPDSVRHVPVPHCSLADFLRQGIPNFNHSILYYYGRKFSWNDIYAQVTAVAKSLKAMGINEGDRIPVFLQAVPEFLILLLAAEKVGAMLVCRDGTPEECVVAIKGSESKILFAHDYISAEDEAKFLAETQLERIITVSPYHFAIKDEMPEHIHKSIAARYPEKTLCNPMNLTWDEFLKEGEGYQGDYEAPYHPFRPLLGAFTSGSTAEPKQVIHSADTMVGILYQMTVYAPSLNFQLRWLHTLLPPALIAVTVCMMLSPMSTNKLLILDPFCDIQDVDLELMRYKPNIWPAIPEYCEVLLKSDRIPEDYSLDFLYAFGPGAEGPNNKMIRRMIQFLADHKSPAQLSVGYGQSECGSNCTMPLPTMPLENCFCGIPMPATVLAIFEKGTNRELNYGEVGEICKIGPGSMIGYQDAAATAEVYQTHDDGKVWLHTGDFGYMTEQGGLYVLGRGLPERFGGGYLFVLPMENKVIDLPGINDGFFVTIPDKEHEGYLKPYLYLVLEEGVALEDVKESIDAALEPHERPVEIFLIKERPYFHFKTNRRGLAAELVAKGY